MARWLAEQGGMTEAAVAALRDEESRAVEAAWRRAAGQSG
jgi:hypothetical protein